MVTHLPATTAILANLAINYDGIPVLIRPPSIRPFVHHFNRDFGKPDINGLINMLTERVRLGLTPDYLGRVIWR